MKQKQIYIFHAMANSQEAKQMVKDINSADVNCTMKGTSIAKKEAWLSEKNSLAVVLISDNFLKALEETRCLSPLLEEAQQERVLLVLADGRRPKAGSTNQIESYTTEISSLNNVMYYRDYWYDEWIRLRKKAKGASVSEDVVLEENKELAKKMSVGIISTLIRQINKIGAVDWEKLQGNNYAALLAKLAKLDLVETPVMKQEEEATKEETQTTFVEAATEEQKGGKLEEQAQKEEEPKEEKIKEEGTKTEETEEEEFDLDIDEMEGVDLENYDLEEVKDLDILFYIAETNTEEGDYIEAKYSYERILELDPSNGRALIWLARLLANHFDKEIVSADVYYKKAIMINDENAKLYYEYGLLHQTHFESYYKASDAFREAIAIDPFLEEAHFGLAQCLQKLGMIEPAKACYLQACALDGERFETKENDKLFEILRLSLLEKEEEEEEETEEVEEFVIQNPNADKVVLITAIETQRSKIMAQKMAVDGYKVVLVGNLEPLVAFKDELLTENSALQVHCLDIKFLDSQSNIADKLPNGWDNITIFVNNWDSTADATNTKDWGTVAKHFLKEVLPMIRLFTAPMKAAQAGQLINLLEMADPLKALENSLRQSICLELEAEGIQVSHIEADWGSLVAQEIEDLIDYVVASPRAVDIQLVS